MFRYSPHQHLPTMPSSPLSISSTSGTDQFPTIQKKPDNSLQVAASGPLPRISPLSPYPPLPSNSTPLPPSPSGLATSFCCVCGLPLFGLNLLLDTPLLGCRLSLDLLQVFFWIRIHLNCLRIYDDWHNSPGIYILRRSHFLKQLGVLEVGILMLPTITTCILSPGTLFHLLFEPH